MAYVTKEVIERCRAGAAVIRKKYGIKLTFSGQGDSSLTCTIQSGKVDFAACMKGDFRDYVRVNQYYIDEHWNGVAAECLKEINKLMHVDHWDESDIQSDYFHCAYYVNINIGRWNKPYQLVK